MQNNYEDTKAVAEARGEVWAPATDADVRWKLHGTLVAGDR